MSGTRVYQNRMSITPAMIRTAAQGPAWAVGQAVGEVVRRLLDESGTSPDTVSTLKVRVDSDQLTDDGPPILTVVATVQTPHEVLR